MSHSRMNSPAQLERYSIHLTRIIHCKVFIQRSTMSQKQVKSLVTQAIEKAMANKSQPKAKPTKAKQSLAIPQSISAPVARTRPMRGAVGPGVNTFTITRREYIADVTTASTAFANVNYPDNPGLPSSYPWLSSIAPNYEQYEVVSRAFLFETEAPTSTPGAVILSYDYDALDSAPVDKTAALLVKDSVRTAPWQSVRLQLQSTDLARRGKLYVRSGNVANSDLKTYDLGALNVSTLGSNIIGAVGELWFEYTIRFHVPQQPSFPGVTLTGGPNVTKAKPFGDLATTVGITPVTGVSNILTFNQPGFFLVSFIFVGTTLLAPSGFAASAGSTAIQYSSVVDATATTCHAIYACRMLNGGTITVTTTNSNTVTATATRIAPWYTSS